MSETVANSYDEIPYISSAFPQTHPDRLATVATLLGLNTAPVQQCRVLELGCSMGDNLIPMAASLPDSTFVGIDLSGKQIATARKKAGELGLANIELRHMDLMEIEKEFGQFEYIICHGVYSWVPDAAQAKIFEICSQNLSENGVAYVSYNTYPGWHMRGLIRDMMNYHASQFNVPKVRVQQARNLIQFLAKSVSKEATPYSLLLQNELKQIDRSSDSYLIHEHLEENNEPTYFHKFIEEAEKSGLKYLGESDLRIMSPSNFPPEVENVLQILSSDIIRLEQYMDFLRNRTFRQTLLCHSNVPVTYALHPERLTPLYVASSAKPVSAEPDIHSEKYEEFRTSDASISLNYPLTKAAMMCLSNRWPQSISLDDLRLEARKRLSMETDADANVVAQDIASLGKWLLTAYTSLSERLVELNVSAPRFVSTVSRQPLACPYARQQASSLTTVTNLRHETVALNELHRQLLLRLDGTRDKDCLLEELRPMVDAGSIRINKDGNLLDATESMQEIRNEALDVMLMELAQMALLVE